jgi:hypothetical protein
MAGICKKPEIIPPQIEVRESRYKYPEYLLDGQPQRDYHIFLRYISRYE